MVRTFTCGCATTSTLTLGEGGLEEIMLEGRRMFRIVLSPARFPNFCHNFCPELSEKRKLKKNNRVLSNFTSQCFTGGSNMLKLLL